MFARGETPGHFSRTIVGGRCVYSRVGRMLQWLDHYLESAPLRRLVAKCFCLGAKTQISCFFRGKNYVVGCRGDVEVVDHSLKDVLCKYRPREALEPTADDLDTIKPIGEALDHAKLT